jgi:transcriptional regulator with XRE-family HTH domain
MKERIKKMRKALKLTQQEFANRIGISRNNVATYEVGKSNPGEAVVSLICREFNVNENWLRTGEGEMFIKRDREDEIAAAVHQLLSGESAEFKKRLISVLVSLKEEHWEILEDKVKELAAAHQEDTQSPAPQPDAEHLAPFPAERPAWMSEEDWTWLQRRRTAEDGGSEEAGLSGLTGCQEGE